MKYLFYSILLIIILCNNNCKKDITYQQFTDDDLSYLYFNSESLIYQGEPVEVYDSVKFLVNSVDTIVVIAKTIITDKSYSPLWKVKHHYLKGESILSFTQVSFLDKLYVRILRSSSTDFDKLTYVSINSYEHVGQTFWISDLDTNASLTIDTALVNNYLYKDVYKYEYNPDKYFGLKYVYFVKYFGFIKIEMSDKRKIELINF